MPAHIGALRKPPSLDSNTKLEDVGSPRWGTGCAKMLAILRVTSSLALIALGGSDP
jgi:hypothetical protein